MERNNIEESFGVYKIENKVNGKIYVGATTNSFKKRWGKHRSMLRARRHCNQYLQEDWDKYGEEQFVFFILEELRDKQIAVKSEQRWLNYFSTKGDLYNIKLSAFIPEPVRTSSGIRWNCGKRPINTSRENRIITFDEIRQIARIFSMNIESAGNHIIMKYHGATINNYHIVDRRIDA